MPLLDVTELFTDPDFATTFDVERIGEDVGDDGRTAAAPFRTRGVVGVVQPAGPTTLARLADGSNLTGAIEIWTTFRLSNGQRSDYQGADTVLWRGAPYTVIDVSPWDEHGGHVHAVARLAALNPPAP